MEALYYVFKRDCRTHRRVCVHRLPGAEQPARGLRLRPGAGAGLGRRPGDGVSAGPERQKPQAQNLRPGAATDFRGHGPGRHAAEDPFFSQCLEDLSAELLHSGFQLGETAYPEEDADRIPAADGYIVLGKCRPELLRSLGQRTPNLVGVWRNPGALPVDQVMCSGQKAAQLAMEHLMELGHRRIAYLGDCSYENRYVGYAEALTSQGLPLIYSLVFNVHQTREDGQRAMETLLRSGEATAVLCASDEVALGALDALGRTRQKRGAVPVSVISIDDIPEAARAGLTTVHIPGEIWPTWR